MSMYSDLVDRAIVLAAQAHDGQYRKSSPDAHRHARGDPAGGGTLYREGAVVPYISHPYAVGMLLSQAGCPEEIVAAGILHDTVEDTPVTLDYLRETFGDRVARIVEGCSEPDKSATWEARKEHTLRYLRTAPHEVRLVACADKLHNVRTIAASRKDVGEDVWSRFKRGRAEQEWYYRGLVEVLCKAVEGEPPIPFCEQLREEVDRLFGTGAEA